MSHILSTSHIQVSMLNSFVTDPQLLEVKMIVLLLLAVFCAGDVHGDITSCLNDTVSSADQTMYINNITLVLFTKNYTISKPLVNASQIVSDSRFNKSSPCTVYMFGWKGSIELIYTEEITQAYVANDSCLIVVNWTQLASQTYTICLATLPLVGKEIAKALDVMMYDGLVLRGIVGHSLGAHCAGYICRSMNNTCSNIVALDPAGPGFTSLFSCNPTLQKTDALCVSVIHTDSLLLGTKVQLGTSDFYPNGVVMQPGCLTETASNLTQTLQDGQYIPSCNHYRAVSYWAENVRIRRSFIGRQCSNALFFNLQLCNKYFTLEFGECNRAYPTTYYLTTNSVSPYGRGSNGD